MRIDSSFYLIPFLILFCSCASFNSNVTILEKSTAPTPTWINENGKINADNPKYINVVFMRSDLYNLPLGLKQSQTIVSKKMTTLILTDIQTQVLQRLEKIYSANKTWKPYDSNTVHLIISRIVNNLASHLKIDPPLAEQVYWEYRQQERNHDLKKYYVTWVLLLIPKTVYDNTFLTIAHELQNSKDEVAVTLGNDLQYRIK